MAKTTVPLSGTLSVLLDSPEVAALIADLEATRWTGRPGYPIRSMVGMALLKSLYNLPTWTRRARLVAEHVELQRVLRSVPSVYACYRFTAKMLDNEAALTACMTAGSGPAARRDARPWLDCRHRRFGPSRLRQRAAVPQ